MKTRIIEKQIRKFLISPSAKPIDYVAENDWIDDDYDNDDEYPIQYEKKTKGSTRFTYLLCGFR